MREGEREREIDAERKREGHRKTVREMLNPSVYPPPPPFSIRRAETCWLLSECCWSPEPIRTNLVEVKSAVLWALPRENTPGNAS